MDSYDQHDVLNAALVDADEYPVNLLRTHSFKHELLSYNETLQDQEPRLFVDEPDYSGVKLVESYDGCGESKLILILHKYYWLRLLRAGMQNSDS